MTVIFPKTPIIIAMNLNTTEKRRTSLRTAEKCVELFAMVVLLRNIKTIMFESFNMLLGTGWMLRAMKLK
jgi:hypothetical protein